MAVTRIRRKPLPFSGEGTKAAAEYFLDYLNSDGLLLFILNAATFTKKHNSLWLRYFKEEAKEDDDFAAYVSLHEGRPEQLYSFEYYERLFYEWALVHIVNSYLLYLIELLSLIFKSRPETLKSSEQERLDFVLQFSSMDDLISAIAEKKIDKLSHQGMRALADFFNKELKLPLFRSEVYMAEASRIIEVRNILVHNRGIINSMMKKRLPQFNCEIGNRIVVDYAEADRAGTFLHNSVVDIDKRAVSKFKLPYLKSGDVVISASQQSRHYHRGVQQWRKNFLATKKGSKQLAK